MKLFWKIAISAAGVVVLIGAVIGWHLVKIQTSRQTLAKAAATTRAQAEQGNAEAQSHLAHMYYYGEGIGQSYLEAARWYQKAADQDDPKAEYAIGYMYEHGQAMAKSEVEATRWYQKAADNGYAKAEYVVASRYYYGQGVPQNYAEAVRWYRKSADQGDETAQYALGCMEYNGQGMPQSYTAAAYLLRRAADQGNALAQSRLAFMYYEGQGVVRDHAEAARLYRYAAQQGDEYARRSLSLMKLSFTKFDKILLVVIFTGCSILLSGSRLSIRSHQSCVPTLAGVSGLAWVALDLWGHMHFGTIQSISAVNAFYCAKGLLAGVSIAMLLAIVWRHSFRIMLLTSSALVVAFNVFVPGHYQLRNGHAFYSINAILVAISVSMAMLLWLDTRRSRTQNNNGAGKLNAPSLST
jgi:TPR repeat protein